MSLLTSALLAGGEVLPKVPDSGKQGGALSDKECSRPSLTQPHDLLRNCCELHAWKTWGPPFFASVCRALGAWPSNKCSEAINSGPIFHIFFNLSLRLQVSPTLHMRCPSSLSSSLLFTPELSQGVPPPYEGFLRTPRPPELKVPYEPGLKYSLSTAHAFLWAWVSIPRSSP